MAILRTERDEVIEKYENKVRRQKEKHAAKLSTINEQVKRKTEEYELMKGQFGEIMQQMASGAATAISPAIQAHI
jgi:hypothetical protein